MHTDSGTEYYADIINSVKYVCFQAGISKSKKMHCLLYSSRLKSENYSLRPGLLALLVFSVEL